MKDSPDVTALLLRWSNGGERERDELVRAVYGELKKIAARYLRRERPDHSLQPTGLVHEAYQKLIDQRRVRWHNRAHFFAVASGLMRRILVDHARRRAALRHGGGAQLVSIADAPAPEPAADVDVLALDGALAELARFDPGQARIVELRYFAGLTAEEAAEALGLSRSTVQREWAMARAWLHRKLSE